MLNLLSRRRLGIGLAGLSASLRFRDLFALATASADEPRDAHYENIDGEWVRTIRFDPPRTNLATISEPSLDDLTYSAGDVSDAPGFFGFERSIEFPGDHNGGTCAAYLGHGNITGLEGETFSQSIYFEVLDALGAPVPGVSSGHGDFTFVMQTSGGTVSDRGVEHVYGNVYRAYCTGTASGAQSGGYWGIIRYVTQRARHFRVSGFQRTQATHPPYTAPSGYIPTFGAPALREGDVFVDAFDAPPQEMTFFMRWVEQGTINEHAANSLYFGVTSDSNQSPRIILYNPANRVGSYFQTTSGSTSASVASGIPKVGDYCEARLVLYGDGSLQLFLSINGVDQTPSNRSSAVAMPETWAAPEIHIGGVGTADGALSLIALDAFAGVQTAAYCKENRGDLYTLRPGDDLSGVAFSRASAATYTTKNPASLPPLPDGMEWYNLTAVYPGGRIPEMTGAGSALMMGEDDAVGTSDPAIESDGLSFPQTGDFVDGSWDPGPSYTVGVLLRGNAASTTVHYAVIWGEAGHGIIYGGTGAGWPGDIGVPNEPQTAIRTSGLGNDRTDWHTVVATVDGRDVTIYLNGVEVHTGTYPGNPPTPDRFRIGRRVDQDNFGPNARVTAAYRSPSALTGEEVASLHSHAVAVLARRGIYMDPPTVEGAIQDQYVIHD